MVTKIIKVNIIPKPHPILENYNVKEVPNVNVYQVKAQVGV